MLLSLLFKSSKSFFFLILKEGLSLMLSSFFFLPYLAVELFSLDFNLLRSHRGLAFNLRVELVFKSLDFLVHGFF
jgi:hypothetical protein